ncbi:MAG TPA: methyltransferase, partial [Rhodanobacteraceae bacterium]|nr:methyltransferase [Rhodanobacteraceae bacterium]
MRTSGVVLLAALVLPLAATAQSPMQSAGSSAGAVKVPAYITRAMNNPARVSDNKTNVMQNDADRKMAAVLTFTGVKPGDTVLELAPGSGYWTSVFSLIVGPKGHVYTVWPDEMAKFSAKSFDRWQGLVKESAYSNVS